MERRVNRRQRRQQEERERQEEAEKDREKLVECFTEDLDFLADKVLSRPRKFEYKDHTADIQIHGWGASLAEAFEQVADGMFAYMTKIRTVEPAMVREVVVEESDMERLLYSFLEELLVVFATEGLIARGVVMEEFDLGHMRLRARMVGERWDPSKHPQGTEIKAITFSNMQLWSPETSPLPEDHEERVAKPEDPAHIFVIVDI